MIRTTVTATDGRPEISVFTLQARATPERLTIRTYPFATRNLFVRAKQRATRAREERMTGTRICAQIKAAIGFVFSILQTYSEWKGMGTTHCIGMR
jgi:hypothetical protein